MDKLFIHNLKVDTLIGVSAWEKQIKQTLLLDIEFAIDASKAARDDNLNDAIDYTQVATRLTDYISSNKHQLLESLAEKSAQLLINEFSLPWLRLTIRKQGIIPNAQAVMIVIERGKNILKA